MQAWTGLVTGEGLGWQDVEGIEVLLGWLIGSKGEGEGEPVLSQRSEVKVQVLLEGCFKEAAFLLATIALVLHIKEVSSARF